MREIVLGTAGHVDHGKTSLVRALTGIDTDRLKEEKKRGITIELGFAFLDLPCGHRLGIIDVPGHERFVKNMVAGATGIDILAFVIAADEGIMPQTREHFEICRLLEVKRGLVILTKKDMVDAEWLELVQEDVRQFLVGSFLEGAPMLAVSSLTGEGLAEVREALDTMVRGSEFSEAHGPFRLPVDRVFSMKGFGVVVTGTSISGRIGVGEEITVYPQGHTAKIRGIQVHGQDVPLVEAGKRTAINIQGLDTEMIARGNMLATPGTLAPSYLLDADFFYLSGNAKHLKNRSRVRVHIGTAEIIARMVLLEDEELTPGNRANVQILLEEPFGAWPGDRYVVRSYSPVATIGGGVIWHGSPPKRRRFREVNSQIFALYQDGSVEDISLLHLIEAGVSGLTFEQLCVKMGQFGKRFRKLLDGPISSRKIIMVDSERQRLVAAETFEDMSTSLQKILADFHRDNSMKPGLSKEELRSRISGDMDQRFFQMLLNTLVKQGVIVVDEATVRLMSHRVSLKADAISIRVEMEGFYGEAGLTPPTVREVQERFAKYPTSLIREVLELMVREQVLLKISEDLYFPRLALAALQEQIVAFIKKEGEIDAPRFKNLTGLTRKFSIPLLEYFDRIKVTIRVGDRRLLRERSN
ncbi:MAG TPA: selenocysteine-specific translation elongation factor [Desulfobulbaceae bacterium]|nr:MAG: selenocysteine-specific translation elongation factor [Deltaproteobacteria bacterium RIFOXYD12_FULL_53_23]HCC54383.1 selenocysteine-specific translation elongation factor [Desulfobulbaceae bacterium]